MIIRTRKLSDKKVIGVFSDLIDLLEECTVTGHYLGGVSFKAADAAELQALNAKANERLIEYVSISRTGGTSDEFRFARGTTNHARAGSNEEEYHFFKTYRVPDSYFDEVGFFRLKSNRNNQNYSLFTSEEILAGGRIVNKLASPITEGAAESGHDLSRVLDQNIADLERVSIDFLERAAASREADEKALSSRLSQLEEEYSKRNSRLEEQKKELERLRTELDDREPQHERRKLRKELTSDLQTLLDKPPEGGFLKRNAVYFLYVATGFLFLLLSMLLTVRIDLASEVGTAAFWASTLKAAISGVGGAAFIWAGLAGLKASTEGQRQFSQQLQKYSFDMDRASWVVETLLQMNSIESAQVPDVWLEAACRELFQNEKSSDSRSDALSALGALLDASARARVGTDGFDFELDRKQTHKVAKQAE